MKHNNIFTRISILVFALIATLSILFILITYTSTTYFFNESTQLLNKDVAAHIAKFTSPFEGTTVNKRKADSVFYNAMVVSPSIEVYFLDTAGKIIYYEAPDSTIKLWRIPLNNINKLIASKGEAYILSPDPKNPGENKIFSAAEVISNGRKLGYIYVILGSKEYNTTKELLISSHITMLALQTFLIITVLSVLISFYYIRRLKHKYNTIIDVLQQYQSGNLAARFKGKYDEFAPITNSFNTMAELLSYNISQLKNASEERKNFIANISHDLRTPLSIASGYTETLLTTAGEQIDALQQKDYIQLVHTKLKQVEEMVKQLFELSKLDAVNFTPKKEPFIFSEILQEVVAGFGITANKKNIHLDCVNCHELYWVNADVKMMERVIQNLVENAVKNTPGHGKIIIELQHSNNELTIVFENTGKPLSQELTQWINGETGNNIHSRPPGNIGLGLAIVKRILELHQSKLNVQTRANYGNHFSFNMQLYQA